MQLKLNLDKLTDSKWSALSYNVMEIMEQNLDKVCWRCLSSNPNIFE